MVFQKISFAIEIDAAIAGGCIARCSPGGRDWHRPLGGRYRREVVALNRPRPKGSSDYRITLPSLLYSVPVVQVLPSAPCGR